MPLLICSLYSTDLALLPILSLNPSFWGVLPPKPPVGGVAPPPNPPRISFSVGCLHAAADTSVII
ncbi:MAG: hypothetical protein EWV58_21325 [Microcystis aeruginosa Ma_MB_F_20061100_S19]|uniref:Uncharacterized protein n=1 Tax=Microcystis aeruginosa DA14 TaxID=1987506 RepID=A0A3E0M1W2_MICAE|nr:MAG: hypothetical protein DWQ56_21650 [Microcystis aeruginosa DA14]TRU09815.1 MAG: hypothetical protein EWV58_21325 [Microcystis aeruginosa Ma_MB_F_20061100_S19]TRU10899.1 MAG: hypothetical protein EWV59_11245 [Microcystis aeruginosa Ma_MB_F_20061100_S19D]TRU13740.1 MAG: hypothetical protein EWV60_03525 [Microcystis sp. Msp_OC_L_20101000_S702]